MKNIKHSSKLIPAFLVVGVVAIGVLLTQLTFAANGSLTLSPSSGNANVGSNLVVTLHENSGSDEAIGVDAVINFPSSRLQFLSATTVAPFTVAPPDSASGGTVQITRGSYSGQTGDKVVSVITFKVLSAGVAAVTFNSSQSRISPANGSINLLTNSPGASFNLSQPSTPVPSTPPTTTSPSTSPSPATSPTPVNTKSSSVTITTKSNSGSSTTVPDNGSVAVSESVNVEPTTLQPEGVKKIEYYLDGELVATKDREPYKYAIDTTQLKNGTYNLESKTYYTNGSTKKATQKLLVNNASAKRSNVGVGYAMIGLLVVGAAFIVLMRKRGGIHVGDYSVVAPESIVTSQTPTTHANSPYKPSIAPAQTVAPGSTPNQPVTPSTQTSAPVHNVEEAPKSHDQLPTPGTVIEHTISDKKD